MVLTTAPTKFSSACQPRVAIAREHLVVLLGVRLFLSWSIVECLLSQMLLCVQCRIRLTTMYLIREDALVLQAKSCVLLMSGDARV